MAENRWYRFSYHAPRRPKRPLQPSLLRDGDSALFLADALRHRGYRYAGIAFNYPHPEQPPKSLIDVTALEQTLTPSDLLVLTTRPPLDDHHEGARKSLFRSYTTLEHKVFAALAPQLEYCSRRQVRLASAVVQKFPRVATYENAVFAEKHGALVVKFLPRGAKRWRRPDEGHAMTLGYACHVRSAWPGGPSLLAAFGLGGSETLIWNYHFAKMLAGPLWDASFVMATLAAKAIPESPVSMAFADAWAVDVLTE
jgi:hypothetical protein